MELFFLYCTMMPVRSGFDSTTLPSRLVATISTTHALSTIRMNARSTNIAHLPSHPAISFYSATPAPSLQPSTLAPTVVLPARKGKTALSNSSSSTFLAALLRQPVTSTLIVSFLSPVNFDCQCIRDPDMLSLRGARSATQAAHGSAKEFRLCLRRY